jgi:hypothetical protein
MPTVSVNLDTTQYVKVNTVFNPMVLQCLRDSVRITISPTKPAVSNAVFHSLSGKDAPLSLNSIDTNVWALAVTDNSSLIVSEINYASRDFFFEVAAGNVPGHTPVNVIGHDSVISTTLASVGNNLGELQTYSTVADIDSISSDDINDTHDIVIEGLDVNYEPVAPQTVTLNGQARVAIPIPLFRILRIYNATPTATQGVIWVYVNSAIVAGKPTDLSNIRKSIHQVGGSAGSTVSNEISTSSSYTISAGKTGFIVFGKMTVSDSKAIELTFWVRNPGGVFTIAHHIDVKNNNYDYFFKLPGKVFEKSDIEVRASVDVGSAEVSVAYDIILKDN